MNKNKITIVFLLFFCGLSHINAQNITKNIEKDIQSFNNHLYSIPDSAFYYINKAHKQSLAIGNDSLIAKTTYNLGLYYYLNEEYLKSKNNLINTITFANKTRQNSVLASSYNILGLINTANDNESESLKLYLKSYEISNKNNLFDTKSKVLINLGNLYLIQNDTIKSLSFYSQSIINSEKHNLNIQLAESCMSAAIIYGNKKNIQKGAELFKRALKIAEKENNLPLQWKLHINLSDLYLNNKKKIESVYYHLQKAEKIQQILEDDSLLFYIYFNYGAYYSEKKGNNEALKYYNKALENTEDIPSDRVLALYKTISEIHAANKNYKTALQFNEKYNKLSDSIFTIEKNKSFSEIQTKYEVEKKNLKIDLLSKEKTIEKNKKKAAIYFGFVLVGGIILLIFFFRNRIKTQKLLQEKEREKAQQDQEIERIMGVVQGQDEERNRLAKEIHDGVGGELAGIKLKLAKINNGIKNENINGIIGQIGGVFQNLRAISHNLSSNFVKDKNLQLLLIDLKNEYELTNEFAVELFVFPDKGLANLPENTKLQLYRIIQELLQNVSKHSKAQKVSITFTNFPEVLNIIIEDNGVGFENKNAHGIGLKNIEERILGIDGTFVIESEKGRGTTFVIDVKNKV